MIKTLAKQIKEYKSASLVTPIFMILEVAMEMVIPLLMASIIDDGVQAGDMKHIFAIGCYMILAAIVGLFAGVMGGKYGAKASTGFARNLREAMYENIQTFSFSNIDKFSTAGLVTRMTTDVTNIQNAYQMLLRMCFRAPVSLICAMLMAFLINARVASIYLVAVVFLGIVIIFIMRAVSKKPADSKDTAVYGKLHYRPYISHGTFCFFEHLVDVVAGLMELVDLIVLTHISLYHTLRRYVFLYAGI